MNKGILFCDGLFVLGAVGALLVRSTHSTPVFLAISLVCGTILGFAANHYNKLVK
jgi:hypothetical protein